MAKNSGSRPGNAKIRFIMLEADLGEGDLTQVTQAIQNALKSSHSAPRLIQAPPPRPSAPDEAVYAEYDEALEGEEESEPTPKPRSSRPAKPRAVKVPVVLNDVDAKSNPSLKDYVGQFDLKTTFEKYLVITHWFREARNVDAVTVDHVYTCFRLLGWPTGSTDFEKPFRNMRTNQWVTGGSKEGFTLTLTGADKIEKRKIKP